MRLDWTVSGEDEGRRAVDVLTSRMGLSRTLLKRIRLHGTLLRNEAASRMIDRVHAGDRLAVLLDAPSRSQAESSKSQEEALLSSFASAGGSIPYRDAHLLIVDKPAGWISHPTGGYLEGTVSDLVRAVAGVDRVHVVNRLDRGTSGLMVVALDPYSHHSLSRQARDGRSVREYLGLVHGCPAPEDGRIDAPIDRNDEDTAQRVVRPSGRPAITEYATQAVWRFEGEDVDAHISLVRYRLETGRTHQIRVHSRHAGFPLVGDPLYGIRCSETACPASTDRLDGSIGRQALHAARLAFVHPVTGEALEFRSRLPEDMVAVTSKAHRIL